MKAWLRKMFAVSLMGLVALPIGTVFYLQQPKFGKAPEGARLQKIEESPNYVDGQFQNLVATPQIVGESRSSTMLKFFFSQKERPAPIDSIPTIKTDLKALDKNKDFVIWLGHSSYFIQFSGKRILIDPVLSSSAAPVDFANKAFAGTSLYKAADMPEIDYLLISHDHWDHLDYPTVTALKPKIKNVICGLGVGAYCEQWGFDRNIIHEADWYDSLEMDKDFIVHVLPARHFSGRLLSPNKTLWTSFALETQNKRIFYSGDGGYGPHFKEIREMFNRFDLVIMENGQYDKSWPYIHMMPEEVALAADELNAEALLPGHSGKFSIANHSWDEPFKRITEASKDKHYRLLTPIIGEPVELENQQQKFLHWWEGLR